MHRTLAGQEDECGGACYSADGKAAQGSGEGRKRAHCSDGEQQRGCKCYRCGGACQQKGRSVVEGGSCVQLDALFWKERVKDVKGIRPWVVGVSCFAKRASFVP